MPLAILGVKNWTTVFFSNQSGSLHSAQLFCFERRFIFIIYNWLVVWNMAFMTFHRLGIVSSQLIFIFFRGVDTTNQYNIYIYMIVAMIIVVG